MSRPPIIPPPFFNEKEELDIARNARRPAVSSSSSSSSTPLSTEELIRLGYSSHPDPFGNGLIWRPPDIPPLIEEELVPTLQIIPEHDPIFSQPPLNWIEETPVRPPTSIAVPATEVRTDIREPDLIYHRRINTRRRSRIQDLIDRRNARRPRVDVEPSTDVIMDIGPHHEPPTTTVPTPSSIPNQGFQFVGGHPVTYDFESQPTGASNRHYLARFNANRRRNRPRNWLSNTITDPNFPRSIGAFTGIMRDTAPVVLAYIAGSNQGKMEILQEIEQIRRQEPEPMDLDPHQLTYNSDYRGGHYAKRVRRNKKKF